jgi:hypothetical protein
LLSTLAKNSTLFSRDINLKLATKLLSHSLVILLLPLTGEMKVSSLPSRIKVNVVLAGLSQPSVVLKVFTLFKLVISSASPNNNLLTALPRTAAATVVIFLPLTSTLSPTVSRLRIIIPTLLLMVNASIILQNLSSSPLHMSLFKPDIPTSLLSL